MRLLCLVVLLALVVLEIGPIPITGLLLVWVVLFRPLWFYRLVLTIYKDAVPAATPPDYPPAPKQ